MALLETKDLGITFDGLVALEGVNFAAEAGKITAVIGPNGAGKTTTLRSTAGLLPKKKGSSIIFDGKDISRVSKKEAKELENQFHIENIYKKIRKIYEYDGAEYIIRVPDGAKAILEESRFLDHCIQRGTRYFERIAKRESYIFFMRRKADPNTPWYTLEVEPGGTVRQKRSYNNDQYADLEDAKPFIAEWQQVVQGRMTTAEIDFARQSKEIRAQEFAELKENGNIIRTGTNAGKLLVDELMHDLMEVEKRVG